MKFSYKYTGEKGKIWFFKYKMLLINNFITFSNYNLFQMISILALIKAYHEAFVLE